MPVGSGPTQDQATDVQNAPDAAQQQLAQPEPLPQGQRPVQAPTQQPAAPPEHRSLMGDLASTIFHVFAGNPLATVDPATGGIKAANLTTAQKFENLAHGAIRGAAAGAAQRGPGSVGRSALAGVQASDEFNQQQRENLLKESANVRETNAGQQRDLLNKASLLKSQQDLAEGSLRIKMTNDQLQKSYADNANSLSELESVPGHEIIGTFKTADDFSKFLNEHPDSTGLAKDFAQHKIVTVPLPDGGFKAIKVPVEFVNQKTAEPFTISQVTPIQDDQGKISYKTTTHTIPAGSVTEGQKITMLGGATADAMKFQEHEDKQKETAATIAEKKAQVANLGAEATEHLAQAHAIDGTQISRPDLTGFTPAAPPGGVKEYNKRLDSFKKNVDQVAQTEGTYQQFNDVLNDINAGKDMTGAESVVALFNAIGISVEPLRGKGMRIQQSVVQDHQNARSFGQDLYQKWLSLKKGDIITPQQVRDYASIASNVRTNEYTNLINQMHADGVSADPVIKMVQGNGKKADDGTIKIFLQAVNGNGQKAAELLHQQGWQ